MFEKAARLKLRFETTRGVLSAEDLWDLPLTTLDSIYRGLRRLAKSATEESLLDTVSTANEILDLKSEIVKHVVKVKLEEKAQSENEAANKLKKTKLLEILGRKQDAALETMSEAEIKAMIESM